MVSIALVDARKTSLTGVQNSQKKSARRFAAVQKRALRIILGNQFSSYDDAFNISNLTSLSERRENLCLSFMKTLFRIPTSFKNISLLPHQGQ